MSERIYERLTIIIFTLLNEEKVNREKYFHDFFLLREFHSSFIT